MSVFIKSLYIVSYGQFENVKIDFSSGFNLVYGKNESGKSTIASFIEGLLYGFDEGKKVRRFNEKQEIYKPINSYKYSGYGIFVKDSISYRVSRNFFDGSYEIYNLDEKTTVESKASNLNYPGEFLLDLDYDLYKNLISNYQSQETLSLVKDKVIEKFSEASDYIFSPSLAIEFLNQKLGEIGTPRAFTKPYVKTKERVEKLESELSSLRALRKSYNKDFDKLYKNRDELANKSKELNELRKLRDDYRNNPSYQNLEEQIKYKNELNFIEKELEKYKDYELVDKKQENATNYKNIFAYIVISLILFVFFLKTKLYYLLILAILLPILMFFLFDYKKGNTKYNLDDNYIVYKGLLKDKEKIEEILAVINKKNQGNNYEDFLALKNIDINEVDNKIKVIENKLDFLSKENLSFEKNLAAVEDKLNNEVDLGDELNFQKENLENMEVEIQAINLAIDTINEISKNDKLSLSKQSEAISEIIETISKGKYEKVYYDEDLKPHVLTKDGTRLDIDKLSKGFYDQVNFAFKFAINANSLDCFLLFDDAFINYDIERLRTALFYLFDLGNFRQIIYFTCHKREEEILNSEEISYQFINLEEI